MKKGKVYLCDLNLVENIDIQGYSFNKKYCDDFIKKIKYICNTFDDVIIFNAPENHSMEEIQPFEHVYLINHIKKELDSNIALFIINRLFMTNIIEPTTDSPLPNTDLCNEYKGLQDELIQGKSVSERIPIFLQVGKEVLHRNTYKHNENLSAINTTDRKIRDIYQKHDSSIYGSIDSESGSIEICDHNGHHIDEYGFDNKKHNKHDSTGKHDIKLHR